MQQNDKDLEALTRRMRGINREIESELQTLRLSSDTPPRAGISRTETGADHECG